MVDRVPMYFLKLISVNHYETDNREDDETIYEVEYLKAITTSMVANKTNIRNYWKNELTPVFTKDMEIAMAFHSEEEAWALAHFLRCDLDAREEDYEDFEVEKEWVPVFWGCEQCKGRRQIDFESCGKCKQEGRQ